MYEYKVLESVHLDQLQEALNKWAQDGWKLWGWNQDRSQSYPEYTVILERGWRHDGHGLRG